MLDWLVSACAARGIYVIIDMHGVVGGQSTSDDTGRSGQNQYWTNNNFQGDTATCGGRSPITSKAIPRLPATT